LRTYYKNSFFIRMWCSKIRPIYWIIKIFRQTDSTFISVLNNLRNNQISAEH
jgi:hypothetical protein